MKKAELQEQYNTMLRSGNWDFRVCELLCGEAGLLDEWNECNPSEVEGVINRAVERLGLTETVYKPYTVRVNLSEMEAFKLSASFDNMDLNDVAERLLVLLASGVIPSAYLQCDDPYSFRGWLTSNGKMEEARELLKRSDTESQKALDRLYDRYSCETEGMIQMYDDAINELKNANK